MGVFSPNSMSAEFLFSLLQQEKATGELQQLQHDFYSMVNTFVTTLAAQTETEETSKRLENTKKMLTLLKERRKQKLLLYMAYNKPLPASVPEEEEDLYNEIYQVLHKSNSNGRISRLKITSDVPEVLTTQGRRIGPFKQGEVVEVADSSDVEFIVKNKIGEIVA